MRWLWTSCLLLASLLPLSAEDWTTADGKTYKNVTVLNQEDDGVRITFDGGVGKIPYYELPVDIQKRFGQDIDSLAHKKQAVDKAIDDAVSSAAAAQDMKLPEEAPVPTPQVVAPSGTPSGNPTGVPGSSPGQVPAPGGGAGSTTTAGGTTNPPNGPPGAQTNGAPPPPPANAGTPEAMPELAEPISHAPVPSGILGATGKQLQMTVASYSYNSALDVCYLDSPAIDVFPDPAPATPPASGQGSSLTFRIVTEGQTPQAPDRFEVTFLSVGSDGSDGSDAATRSFVFMVDDAQFKIDDSAKKDSGMLPGSGPIVQYITFYMKPDQLRQICTAKKVTFSVGDSHYRIDEQGATALRGYLADVDTLAPAPSSLTRSFYKMLARIPSFFSIISTICEYVIVGSFALLVAASIAAFILGVSRFIKM